MRCSLTMLAMLAVTMAFSQITLQPKQLVNTIKENGATFEQSALFKASQQNASAISRKLDPASFTLLRLDEERLSQTYSNRPEALEVSLPAAGRSQPLVLELVRVDPFSSGFKVTLASSGQAAAVKQGVHYRGVMKGKEQSVASLSLFEGEAMGLISAPGMGNLVLGRQEGSRNRLDYVLYEDADVLGQLAFDCATSDEGVSDYRPEQLKPSGEQRSQSKCTNIYLEVDHDVFLDKGGASGTTNYITGLFNEVATLYANENVSVRLSELLLWDEFSPYVGNNSYTLLTQFVDNRPDFNGDLGQLISYQASGGIAYLSGLCNQYSPKHSFSSINANYASVPTYSYSVMVVAHELGHLFGSRHTHACAWNGDNTAIDGCAGFTEGNCPSPEAPAGGGTIMSYCHLSSVGINFSRGFGAQPGNLIRNAVSNASCLASCQTGDDDNQGDDDNSGCEGQTVELSITLDVYGIETSWELRDSSGKVLYEGGPYPNTSNGTEIVREMCLSEGCYEFEIFDAYGDGICCSYGQGAYALRDSSGTLIADGGQFESEEMTEFCLPLESEDSTDCTRIDFREWDIVSYGGGQDNGSHALFNEGEVLQVKNNAWKAIELEYEVTPNTVIELEFGSTRQGEIHGIGFDDNNSISASRTFRLYGLQNWGIDAFDQYQGGATWQKFVLPVGEYYTGVFDKLFFVADHDRSPRNGNSFFRNIIIHEGDGCATDPPQEELASGPARTERLEAEDAKLALFPNPADQWLNVQLKMPQAGEAHLQVFSISGQLLQQQVLDTAASTLQEQLDISKLSAGTYVLKVTADQQQLVERFTVSRF